MPGVVVTTATRSGPSAPLRALSGQVFMTGLAERGSVTDPITLRGMADVEANLGGRVTYGSLYDQLKTFFDEGGRQAVVARVVGAAATAGTLTLQDRGAVPTNTLRVDAASPGDWSETMEVEIRDGSVANTFRMIVTVDGTVVHDVNNLASPADAVSKFASSSYVTLTDLGSPNTGSGTNNPAITAPTALSAGTDDRTTVTTADLVAALSRFDPGLGDGAVCIPGQTGDTAWQGIIDHCVANNRIGILASGQGESQSNLVTQAAGLDSEFAGLFAPWIVVSDGGTGTRTISPEGYVAACRARAHEQVGPWRAPAGAIGKADTILDVDVNYTKDEADALDDSKVSVIRKIAGSVRLYGWRSLSNDFTDYAYLKDRDLLNRLVVEAESRLEDYVFGVIDRKGQLLASVHAELIGMVEPIRQAGGLYERIAGDGVTILDPGYAVDTGSDVNTDQTLANNEIHARLLVRVSPTGGLVALEIVKVGLLSGM